MHFKLLQFFFSCAIFVSFLIDYLYFANFHEEIYLIFIICFFML